MTDTKHLDAVLERERDVKDAASLAQLLYGVVDGELAKDDADGELVFGAAELLAYLGGDSEAESEAGVARIRETVAARTAEREGKLIRMRGEAKTRGVRWKLIVPIAAAIVLLASLAAVTFAGGGRILDWTNDDWKSVEPGEKLVDGSYEAEKAKDHREYGEFEALLAAEGVDGVLAPKDGEVADVLVIEFGEYRRITAKVTDESGRVYDYEAQCPSQTETINAELTKVGGFDVSLSNYDGVYQAEFIWDGVRYIIGTDDPDALTAFVASLGE